MQIFPVSLGGQDIRLSLLRHGFESRTGKYRIFLREINFFFSEFFEAIFLADQHEPIYWTNFRMFLSGYWPITRFTFKTYPIIKPNTFMYMFLRVKNPFLALAKVFDVRKYPKFQNFSTFWHFLPYFCLVSQLVTFID